MSVPIDNIGEISPAEAQLQYIDILTELLAGARSLLQAIISANTDVPVTIGLVAALLDRIIESGYSIKILSTYTRSRDISVLLLNIIELRIDLQYIALSSSRETQWLQHSNEWRKPWKIGNQLKEIFPDQAERKAEEDIYHMYSMIKHGSPAKDVVCLSKRLKEKSTKRGVAFNITCDGNTIAIDQGKFKHMIGSLLFTTGYNIHQACCAIFRIISRRELNFPELEKQIDQTVRSLHFFNERAVIDMIVNWARMEDHEIDQSINNLKDISSKLDDAKAALEQKEAKLNEARERLSMLQAIRDESLKK